MRSHAAVAAALIAMPALAAGAPVASADFDPPAHISQGVTGGTGAFDVTDFPQVSADGSHVFFTTAERLVDTDTDSSIDIYERTGTTTTLVSAGEINGNLAFDAFTMQVSADGSHLIFQTQEKLTSTDGDDSVDLYDRSGGTTTLVSAGEINGNGAQDVTFAGASVDASHVLFLTNEVLTSEDGDGLEDLYERVGGTTVLVSQGPTDTHMHTPVEIFASADGSRIFFQTSEHLTGDDDVGPDVFERSAGTTTVRSPNTDQNLHISGVSADGARVFFNTTGQATADDMDGTRQDVFEHSSGTLKLVSAGGNGMFDAIGGLNSADGTHVVFETNEKLSLADMDDSGDVYDRSGGVTTLVSTGPDGGQGAFDATQGPIASDGSRAVFTTQERLVNADTDSSMDLYERVGGATTNLVSTGPAGGNGAFEPGAFFITSPDGTRVTFTTAESLVGADTDGLRDVYQRTAGKTYLVSKGTTAADAALLGTSSDGSRVFFSTPEKLAGTDTDSSVDFYSTSFSPDPDPPGPDPAPPPTPDPAPMPDPSPQPQPEPKPTCTDKLAPVTHLKVKVKRKAVVMSGTSKDRGGKCPSGVRIVQVSLARVKGRTGVNCRFVKTASRYAITREQNCRKPVLFKAKGTGKWKFTFKLKLPRGMYRAQARGTDKSANKETPRTGRKFFTV